MLDGGFNVNSTSVEAWKAVLSAHDLTQGTIEIPTFADPAGGSASPELSFSTATEAGRPIAFWTRNRSQSTVFTCP